MRLVLLLSAAALLQHPAPSRPQKSAPKPATARAAKPAPTLDALPVQVMLARAGFSPGVIDGKPGLNTQKALAVYQQQGGDPAAVPPDAVLDYTVTADDANGPYIADIPTDLVKQAELPALSYRTPLEALSERFHATPALIQALNPGATFAAGSVIKVPNVEPMMLPPPKSAAPAAGAVASATPAAVQPVPPVAPPAGAGARGATPPPATAAAPAAPALGSTIMSRPPVVVTVSKAQSALTVTDEAGKIIFYAPVTTGSSHDPLPIGDWKVNGVQLNPTFHYNPELFWDANASQTKATIPAGPNNPVGPVWIDISKDHYGIHGTPEPSVIGRAESHGCVRLTNWDALKVASLVKPGTRVVFEEGSSDPQKPGAPAAPKG